jgi:molecular chaperone GrpE
MVRASVGRPLLHDDDPAEGSESPEQDPLAALIRPAERNSLVDPGAADAFQKRANLAEDRLTEVLNAYRQLKTENEGFRDRITRNLERRFDQRRERLLLKFIEILDNLDRALEATEQTYTGTPMIEGIILVRTQLLSVLQEEGLERIPVLGMPYDPSVAEAVETRPVTEPEHHHVVVKELMRGYRLHGRVARASRVAVGEYAAAADAATVAPSDEEGSLVGADEAEVKDPAPPPVPEEAKGVRGFDAALDDLIAPEPEPEPEPESEAEPVPEPAPESEASAPEIDLLKEVLDEDDR